MRSSVSITPPLPGATLATQINDVAQSLGTDFAGADDPASMAWAYSSWADTGNGLRKRRNAANAAWVVEGVLFKKAHPQYAVADIPTTDQGPIYVIGVGDMEWNAASSAYAPVVLPIRATAPGTNIGPCYVVGIGVMEWDSGLSAYVSKSRTHAIGDIFDWGGPLASIPSGAMQMPIVATNVSRTTYAALWAVYGTMYGAGDGSTTFGIPYAPAGYATVHDPANGGTLTVGQVINHTHPYTIVTSGAGIAAGSPYGTTGTSTGNPSGGGSANLAAALRVIKCIQAS